MKITDFIRSSYHNLQSFHEIVDLYGRLDLFFYLKANPILICAF
jgi:glutathionylspermidine synthase